MATLILAEHDHKTLTPGTLSVIKAAMNLGDADIHLLVMGASVDDVAEKAAAVEGVTKVRVANHDALSHGVAESAVDLLTSIAADYVNILAPASTFGKNILPRLAATLDVGQVSDVIEVINATTFKRPIYAGNAIATVESMDTIKVMTVRPTAFDKVSETGGSASVESIDVKDLSDLTSFVSLAENKSDRPDLTSARVVISGGRGLENGENFKLLETLADHLNGAIGASRAAVDAGYVPNDYQVGQTGKVVAPDLYIAIGISGAIQHLAGMKDSKVIVAINKDEDAPIFQVADYGLVADLFEAVPELTAAISDIKKSA